MFNLQFCVQDNGYAYFTVDGVNNAYLGSNLGEGKWSFNCYTTKLGVVTKEIYNQPGKRSYSCNEKEHTTNTPKEVINYVEEFIEKLLPLYIEINLTKKQVQAGREKQKVGELINNSKIIAKSKVWQIAK